MSWLDGEPDARMLDIRAAQPRQNGPELPRDDGWLERGMDLLWGLFCLLWAGGFLIAIGVAG